MASEVKIIVCRQHGPIGIVRFYDVAGRHDVFCCMKCIQRNFSDKNVARALKEVSRGASN